ncbi:hypothetical protein ACOME3_008221 [Neoechinorhynchus agilis]
MKQAANIVKSVLGENYTLDEDFVEALNLWGGYSGSERIHNASISDSCDLVNRTRLTAASTRESSAWLNAIPIAPVGTLQRDSKDCSVPETWGTDVYIPSLPLRSDCGSIWASLSRPSAIWRKVLTTSRSERNSYRVLNTVNAPNILEPLNLYRLDGCRPDGVAVFPWRGEENAFCGTPRGEDITIISSYVPQIACTEENKQQFWQSLSNTVANLKSIRYAIDFNGHVGNRGGCSSSRLDDQNKEETVCRKVNPRIRWWLLKDTELRRLAGESLISKLEMEVDDPDVWWNESSKLILVERMGILGQKSGRPPLSGNMDQARTVASHKDFKEAKKNARREWAMAKREGQRIFPASKGSRIRREVRCQKKTRESATTQRGGTTMRECSATVLLQRSCETAWTHEIGEKCWTGWYPDRNMESVGQFWYSSVDEPISKDITIWGNVRSMAKKCSFSDLKSKRRY